MANNINNYPDANAIGANDDLLMSKGGSQLQMINYNKLAKAIIEEYASSNVAGANQTLKAALDNLNSNSKKPIRTLIEGNILDLNIAPGSYYVINATNNPSGTSGAGFLDIDVRNGFSTSIRRVIFNTYGGSTYVNTKKPSADGWYGWTALK